MDETCDLRDGTKDLENDNIYSFLNLLESIFKWSGDESLWNFLVHPEKEYREYFGNYAKTMNILELEFCEAL